MYRKTILSIVFIAVLSTGLMAQQEPGSAVTIPPEAEVCNQQMIADDRDVQSMIDETLSAKGWTEGENTKANGEIFYITIGHGTIQAPRTDRNFAAARVAAYNRAMIEAKRSMVEYLGVKISSELESNYTEGVFPQPESVKSQNQEESSIYGKINQLIHAKLDDALRNEGIDPDAVTKEQLAEAAKHQLAQEEYSKLISIAAQSYVCGMQVYNSFEYTPANGKGQIGVIAIWSPKLQKMAEALTVGGAMPAGVPKQPIVKQIPNNENALLTTFGVQQKIDENGNLVLVSFGQEGALTTSPRSADAASRKAQVNAMAAIREFAGETVAVSTDMLNAETTTEFENAAEEYENTSAYREKIKATADSMNISGITTIKRWKAKHPVSGKYIYGVVCAWSPTSSANAKALKAQMSQAPGTTNSNISDAEQSVMESTLQQNSFQGTGLSADDDAF